MDCLSSSILQFPKKKSNFECSVHRYVCRRFQLEEDTSETDLYKLAVASIRKLKPGLTQKHVEELLAGSWFRLSPNDLCSAKKDSHYDGIGTFDGCSNISGKS